MEHKYLDAAGITHLWSKLSLEDYPNNELLIAVINAIDENKADKADLKQADWKQTDETALDFIKNKPDIITKDYVDSKGLPEGEIPHQQLVTDTNGVVKWVEREFYKTQDITIVPNATYGIYSSYGMDIAGNFTIPVVGETYHVIYGDIETDKVAVAGNRGVRIGEDYNEFIIEIPSETNMYVESAKTGQIVIEITHKAIKKIDAVFLPDLPVATSEDYGTVKTTDFAGKKMHNGNDAGEIFNDYNNNVASGAYSHAEGYKTNASYGYAHAEGNATTASNEAAHAEGYKTIASGMYSHAEGWHTQAKGGSSHAEGRSTIAYSYQHVQGKHNIEDTSSKYAHIVGNGNGLLDDPNQRSNAHTLDWNGNAWFQGEVKIGGTGQDDATAKILATTEYVDNALQEAQNYTDEKTSVCDSAVLFTRQDLTEEQKAQARENLGITDTNIGGTTPPEETGPVTTEYVYTYDGDTNSEEHNWILNYGGTKVFAKMGEIPEGELNLVGATLFRTNPSNQWLDRTFTITEEHLNKVLNKSNTDIPATQDGLIQIYDLMASDFSEFTVLCICTTPGWYNVCFDDWYEIINFPETGIYGYDKRTYGGNDYLKSFTFSATFTPPSSGGGGSGSTGGNTSTVTTPVKYTGNEISMFARGICIGDSVTEGSFDGNGGVVVKRFSYPAILERISGVDIANAGIAGATSQSWYEAAQNSDSIWGKWVNQEWVWNSNPTNTGNDIISSTLDFSGFDFAVIHLGINDLAAVYDNSKTIDEILVNYETSINTIISALKTANNGIKIFMATIVPSYASPTNQTYKQLNDKIKEIVEANTDVYLMDINAYSELASKPEYNVTHPTALGYHKLANEIKSYISYIISKNLGDFTEVQFIGM